jgi:tetraacyldisaccharide-1-P 4'-kinase
MSDNIRNSNARLETLLKRIMTEKDPVKYDELCSELWLVLDEREIVSVVESRIGRASKTAV